MTSPMRLGLILYECIDNSALSSTDIEYVEESTYYEISSCLEAHRITLKQAFYTMNWSFRI
jgi:hypothetical protein